MSFTFKLNRLKFLIFGKTPQDVCKEYNEEYKAKYESYIESKYNKGSVFCIWKKERDSWFPTENDKSPAEIMGLEMGKYNVKTREIKAIPAQNPHKESPYIEVDENGDIFPEQFELDYIKAKYNSDDYEVTEDPMDYGKYITVFDKKTGKKIIDSFNSDSKYTSYRWISVYDSAGDEKYQIHIEKENGGLSALLDRNRAKKYMMYISRENFPNEHKTINKLYVDDGKLKSERIYIYGNNVRDIIYRNGEPYKSLDENQKTIQNFVVNEIIECLKDRNFWGRVKDADKLKKIISKVDKENIYEILVVYKRKTGRSLYSDLKKSIEGWLPIPIGAYYRFGYDDPITHLDCMKNCYSWSSDFEANNYYAEYAAQQLRYNPNNTQYLKNIDNFNAKQLFIKYKELAEKNPDETKSANLFEAMMNDEDTKIETRINNVLNLIEECKFINNKEILEQMTDVGYKIVMEHCKNNCEDIKDHMILNRNNQGVLLIDLIRYINREEVSEPPEISKPNGEIDMEQEQGKTGDCWLLAGCISIYKKPEGKNILESLIDVNKETGDVTVTFKGVNKQYTVTYEELKKATYLSGGDGDIRAIELAFNKYQHEKAIETNSRHTVDINGNTVEYVYDVLLGNSERIDKYNPEMNDMFNDPDKFYEIGSSGWDIETGVWLEYEKDLKDAMINDKGELTDFVTHHAYAVIKADENYVYLVNPWDSSTTLKITPKKLESLFIDVGVGKLK